MFVYKWANVVSDIMECVSEYEVRQGFDKVLWNDQKPDCPYNYWDMLEREIGEVVRKAYPVSEYEREEEKKYYESHCKYYYDWSKKCDQDWQECPCEGLLKFCPKNKKEEVTP